MASESESIVDYLARVREKDRAKGFDGFRATREVADYMGTTMATARKRLLAHWADDEIECRHNGNMYLWRARPLPRTPPHDRHPRHGESADE